MKNESKHLSGVGVGLRPCHYSYIEKEQPEVAWFEVLTDNYLYEKNMDLFYLEKIRSSYPITLHGVGMSLGSTDPINFDYLKKLKLLIKNTEPHFVSDHLAWTSFQGKYFHELLPLPFTEEAIIHVVNRIKCIQDFFEQPLLIENISSYLSFSFSSLMEWDFLQTIADESNCLILLDINNIYVSAYNNKFDPLIYLNKLNKKRIAQLHLGGFENKKEYLLDTHSQWVAPCVWELFLQAIQQFGLIPTCIEWDNEIPPFPELLQEIEKAKNILENRHVDII